MKKISVICFLFLTSAITCLSENNKQKSELQINTFNYLPKEIDGCRSCFYLSKIDKRLNKYIYVNDFAKYSFIKIGNQLEKFTLVKNYSIGKIDVYLYKNKSIQLKIEIKTKKVIGEEDTNVTGTMTVETSEDGKKIIDFIGDIGC